MLDPACITRNILADKPRVTRFPIDWNAAPGEAGGAAAEGAAAEEGIEDDEMGVGEDNTVEEETGVSEANATGEPDVSWEGGKEEGGSIAIVRVCGGRGEGWGRGRWFCCCCAKVPGCVCCPPCWTFLLRFTMI